MRDLFTALALAVIIEGLVYAAFPEQMKRALVSLLATPNSQLRVVALTLAGAGLVALYLIRG
ncbi:hypothetical protein MNBD_ALPHA12-349 [hydrothermal vent metagenome]|uniref:Inner membrane protein YjeT (Clustered with HflC) n=1 Tax=hydrothermal vent metagenome TaxID=652676 RepID=A0A3B0TP70_9ZZZZ